MNKVLIQALLQYSDFDGVQDDIQVVDYVRILDGRGLTHVKQLVKTTVADIELGNIINPGFMMLINRDVNHAVYVSANNTGTPTIAVLHPAPSTGKTGGCCLMFLGNDALNPGVYTTSGDAWIDVFITAR